jgi:hypothetical protein
MILSDSNEFIDIEEAKKAFAGVKTEDKTIQTFHDTHNFMLWLDQEW